MLARLLPFLQRAQEGQPRPGPWLVNDGWIGASWPLNFFQAGYDPTYPTPSSFVEACVAAYANTIAMCQGDHWRSTGNGGRERVTTSALSRILRRPSDYQSRSDFIMNLVRGLYLDGNAYALAERNDRFEVTALHLFDPRMSKAVVGYEGDVFYSLAGNNIIEARARASAGSESVARLYPVPARNVLHVKLEAKADEPLLGIAPHRHAAIAVATQSAIGSQLVNFFMNMSRPSGVLQTDRELTGAQVSDLRERWNDQAKGLNAGGVPILSWGLKYQGISVTAKDAEMIEALRLTADEICMVYGVPPAILGITDRATFASTEAMMQWWLARGLGFAINHVEVAFDHFFGLRGWPDEYVEFDTRALLRSTFKERIEGLARGVQGGIYAPNEAREIEELPAKPFGDEPRVQQQVVPLSQIGKTEPAPAPEAPPSPPPAEEEKPEAEEEEEAFSSEERKAIHLVRFHAAIREAERARRAA